MSDKTKLKIVAMICGTVLFIAVFVCPTRRPHQGGYMRSMAGDLWYETRQWFKETFSTEPEKEIPTWPGR